MRISVIGCGYVGLVTGACLAEIGHDVVCTDNDESKIKTLSSREHIRLRTGMSIGRIGNGTHYDDGCYILLKEVIDNAIDEYIMGYGKEVQIQIQDKTVVIRDFGRGIPLGKLVDCVSTINTGPSR